MEKLLISDKMPLLKQAILFYRLCMDSIDPLMHAGAAYYE